MNLLGLNEDQRLGLLAAGLATLAGRGSPMQTIGQGGIAGVNAMMGAKASRKQEEFDALKLQMLRDQMEQGRAEFALKQQEYAGKAQAAEADAADRSAIDAAKASPFALFAATGPVPRETDADRYQRMAQATKNPAYAKIYGELADKAREKFGDAKVVMRGNEPTLQRYGDHGSTQFVPGVAPAPDNQVVNLGGTQRVIDKLRTPAGTSFPVTQTATERDASARGWAGLALQREQEKRLSAGGDAGPKWDSTSGQFVYPPSAQNPAGRAVAPEGYVGKADAKAVQSERALAIIQEARPLIKNATGSYAGAAVDQGARLFGGTTTGGVAISQLQALEAALMMNQPRMEGPQSNLDVALYKQAAGKIGDPTIPQKQKLAALDAIEKLHRKYAEISGKPQAAPEQSDALSPAEQAELDELRRRFKR